LLLRGVRFGMAGATPASAEPCMKARAADMPLDAGATPTWLLDFELRRGAFLRSIHVRSTQRVIALVGASGAGKTSLLYAIAGLLRPQRGRIEVGGHCLFDAARGIDVPAHRRRIGFVFQDARLFPHLDVRHNLLYGLRGDARDAPRFGLDAIVDLLGI